MPRSDGTGPKGQGPMTGRGRGFRDAGTMAGAPPGQAVQAAPGQASVGDPKQLLGVLEDAIKQAVDEKGYVDVIRLVTIWPQVAQAAGVNVPFQVVMQLVQQNPQILQDLIVRLGLAGVIADGKVISADQLAGMGSGAV